MALIPPYRSRKMKLGTSPNRRWALGIVPLLGLLLGACSVYRGDLDSSSGPSLVPRGALVTVSNQNAQDVRVYLVRGRTRIPLGRLGTGDVRSFAVSSAMLGAAGGFRLHVATSGGLDGHTSSWIQAAAGDQVEWTLAQRLEFSRFRVRLGR